MSVVVQLTPETRAQLTAAYRALRARAGTPRWVVRAYVLARHQGQDRRAAMAAAHFGAGPYGPGVGQAVNGWLQQLEGKRS